MILNKVNLSSLKESYRLMPRRRYMKIHEEYKFIRFNIRTNIVNIKYYLDIVVQDYFYQFPTI